MMMKNLLFSFVTVFIAVFIIIYAYLKKKIDGSALIATGFVGFFVIISVGVEWIYILLGFFVFGNLATRYKYKIKENRGVAEGVRTFRNVFGNGASATIFALFYSLLGRNPIFLFGFLGAMSTAGADTFATEIGEAHEKHPRLITNLRKKVKIGTPGAVSLPGFLGALVGATIISFIPLIFGTESIFLFAGIIASFFGCIIDSLIGATIERERIDKHMTNFFATLAGGIIAMIFVFIFT
jgi:uncharacterized protein (TIGR00297 family)